MKLSEKLELLRKSKDYSQEYLANYLGIGQTTYSRYETLKTYPDIFIIKKLAKLYNITIDELVNDVEETITIALSNEELQVLKNLADKINAVEIIRSNDKNIRIGNNNNINNSFNN